MPSLYEISIPVFIRGLTNLSNVLSKGSAYADAQKIPATQLLEARLIDDMAALPFQIQTVSNMAKGAASRVGGVEGIAMADDETTFEQLQARIQKTIEYLKTVPADSINGKEDVEIVLKPPGREWRFTGQSYLLEFALPNFYFHITTAYDLLRHKGVPLGKMDYLGNPK